MDDSYQKYIDLEVFFFELWLCIFIPWIGVVGEDEGKRYMNDKSSKDNNILIYHARKEKRSHFRISDC